MIGLPWSVSWFQPGMSAWAIACRIAFVSTAPLRAVLEHLSGATAHWRTPLWFQTSEPRTHLATELGLSERALSDIFLGPVPERLAERQHACLRLRWCPRCLDSWYHSAQFQDTRLDRCPVHGCLLQDRCPRCDRAVDPLGVVPWYCSSCRSYLAQPPSDWLDAFERPVPSVPKMSFAEEGGAGESATLFVPACADVVAPDSADSYRYLAWRQHFLFEDACAVWDTLGKAHRACALDEPQAGLSQYSAVEFSCPVAGALLHAYGKLDVAAELRRGWHVWRATTMAVYGLSLPWSIPDWAVPAATRSAARRLVLKELKSFGRAAILGRPKTYGSGADALTPEMRFLPGGVFIDSVATESDLLKAIELAEKLCPKALASVSPT